MSDLNLTFNVSTDVKSYYKDKADLVFKHKDNSISYVTRDNMFRLTVKEFKSVKKFNEYSKVENGPEFVIGGRGLYTIEKDIEQQLLNNNSSVTNIFQMYY